jgi:hypothetical protein
MFKAGDKIIRVKHARITFRLMSWKFNVFFYEVMGSTNLLMQKYKS